MDKLLSVVIITYNRFEYLNRLLDTIMAQTYPNIEIIVSDDGSASFDAAIIEAYIEEHKRDNIAGYKVIHSDVNQGTVRNLNAGIKASSGDYIKLIAGDDLYPSDSVFEKQVELLESKPYIIVTGKVRDCAEDETPIHNETIENSNNLLKKVYSLPKEKRLKYALKRRLVPYVTQAFCFRKSFFDKYGLFDERFVLMEDSEMPDRIVRKDIEIGILDEVVVLHRAEIGVSANNIVINPRSEKYYKDTKLWFQILYKRERNLIWKMIYHNHYMMACYRLEMIASKGKCSRIFCSIKYLPSLIIYSLRNPQMIIPRFKGLLSSFKLMKGR